ncbi:hypothetical protein HU200_003646 [Digitaria exilis]|uniref:Uncharacterized protein n=1 Tax=Digitaria exilis TaxID=1010633 RepID=A0A835FV23_9POAL|nr:hypothetical protein HU200_041047 [Digitaria exilis]KAF8776312.1 hypothetical protein HU200_003646 [Digitaria exilis]
MDNLDTHSEHVDQPEGQQANGLPFAHINLSPFWFILEQYRLQLDRVLKKKNEQVRMSLQQEISMQNTTLINHLNHAEIATLRRALQRTQEDLETTQYHMNEVVEHAVSAYVINDSIFCMLAAVQQETNSHVSSIRG